MDEKQIRRDECIEGAKLLYEYAATCRFNLSSAAVELAAMEMLQRHLTKEEAMQFHLEHVKR
jgi:hypothetical protein